MRTWKIACAVVVGTLGPSARAQGVDTISLEAALARAAQRPSVALRGLDVEAARAAGASVARYNPEVRLGAGPQFGGDAAHPRVAVGVSQTIESGGKRDARRGVADAQTAAARVEREVEARRARVEAWRAFAHAQLARDRLAARREVEQLATSLAAAVSRAAQAGGAPALRVHLVVAEAGKSAQQRGAAETDYAFARAQLATAIGAAADEDLAPAGDPPGLASLPAAPAAAGHGSVPAAAAGQSSMPGGPAAAGQSSMPAAPAAAGEALTVRLARSQAALERARIADADARGVSDLTIGVEYEYAPDPDGAHAIVGTLAFPLAIRDRNQAERAASRIVARRAELAVSLASVEASRAARLALASYQRARGVVAGLDREVSGPLQASLSAAQDAFTHGGLELVELIAIQRGLIDARLAYLDARLALVDAWAELSLVAGLEVAP